MSYFADTFFDPSLCKEAAIAFFRTACLIDERNDYIEFKGDMVSPYAVNLMLSCELFFKYLLLPHIRDIPRKRFNSHNLSELNRLLIEYDPNLAQELENRYYEERGNAYPHHSFDEILKLNANNFVEFRYLYELEENKTKAMYSSDVAALARALKTICCK